MRISYRGQTLNSKNGYNRSGLSRLVIEEKEEETLELPQTDEQPDPKGLPALAGGWKTGKRDAGKQPDNQKSRKRRKLKYAVMEDDWGLGDGNDMQRMENEELARMNFLEAGNTDCKAGKVEKQTTIKIWSKAELTCREIVLGSILQSRIIGKFKVNLEEQLKARISARKTKILQEDGARHQEPQNNTLKSVDTLPEGWKAENPDKAKDDKKQLGCKQNTIISMFAKQNLSKDMKLEKTLLKEERLENKRRLELRWKSMKIHAARMRWAREWLEEEIILPVMEAGNKKKREARRMEAIEASNDFMDVVMAEVKKWHDCGYSTACPSWVCMKVVQNRMPIKVAEGWKQKQKMEAIPEGRRAMKREREPEDTRPEGRKDMKNKVNLNEEPIFNIKKFPRSPVKDLIYSFEQLTKKNLEGSKTSSQNKVVTKTAGFQKIPSTNIERSNTGPAISSSNKICNNMYLKPECSNIPTNEQTDRPTVKPGRIKDKVVKQNIPVGGKQKPLPAKKVWTRLKSGLFGWKTLARPTISPSGEPAKTVSVIQPSQVNKISKIRQYSPPELIFGGEGTGYQLFNKTKKIFEQRDRVLAEKSSTTMLDTGGHSGVNRKCGSLES